MQSNEINHGDADVAVEPVPEENPAESAPFAVEPGVAASEAVSQAVSEAADEAAAPEAFVADAGLAPAEVAPVEAAAAPEAPPAVEMTEAGPAPGVEAAEPTSMNEWLAQVDHVEAESTIRRGDIVEGEIVQTSPTEILIDIGAKAEGVVSGRELERMDRKALEELQPGQKVLVYVLNPEGRGGNPVLSLARAQEEQDWRQAEEFAKSQEVYEGKIAGYNKGGLIVRFGKVRGFVPASQISAERRRRAGGASPEERWSEMIGETILVKVVEVDRARNRLILSERAATREWRSRQKERLLDELTVGETREGRVISVTDFGVFVDLGGADGLVHLSELTWKPISHPKEIIKVGKTVTVKVISVDRERRRIGLSMKQLEEDPWDALVRTHQVGQLVQGTITKLTKFGAFARLVGNEEIEGLIHISEFADTRVAHPRDVVAVGDVLTLRIVKFDPVQRRLGLSIKEVDSPRYADLDWRLQQQAAFSDGRDEVEATEAAPTIGDAVGYAFHNDATSDDAGEDADTNEDDDANDDDVEDNDVEDNDVEDNDVEDNDVEDNDDDEVGVGDEDDEDDD